MLFWSFLLSTLIYFIGGLSFSLSVPVVKKRYRILVPLLYVMYGLLRLIFVEALASKFFSVVKIDIYFFYFIFILFFLQNLVT